MITEPTNTSRIGEDFKLVGGRTKDCKDWYAFLIRMHSHCQEGFSPVPFAASPHPPPKSSAYLDDMSGVQSQERPAQPCTPAPTRTPQNNKQDTTLVSRKHTQSHPQIQHKQQQRKQIKNTSNRTPQELSTRLETPQAPVTTKTLSHKYSTNPAL